MTFHVIQTSAYPAYHVGKLRERHLTDVTESTLTKK